MIAKGSARSGPKQLAVYLMRVGRYDTGEPTQLLELKSPWAEGLNFEKGPAVVWRVSREGTAAQLAEAFRDWQTLGEGTQQGEYGLYHAQISPAPQYARKMTTEQWKRSADILGEELGLQDQPRAVVVHDGKDGRMHLHVVWARTDIDEMKFIPDSYNYQAHERASMRMELEFGQEFVPGKHAKRDREQQPEFPREKMSQDEAQQAARLGMTKAERIAEIAEIRKPCDDGLAFKNALEEAGYILAKGDSRGFVLVDEQGEKFSLSKHLPDLKGKEFKAFMASVVPAILPTVAEAQGIQEQRLAAAAAALPVEHKKQAPEASKFLSPELAAKLEPTPPVPAKAEGPAPIDITLYAPEWAKGSKSKFLPPDLAQKIEPPPPVAKVEPPAPALAPAPAPLPVPAPPSTGLPGYDYGLYANYGNKAKELPPIPPAPEKIAPAQEDPEIQAIKKALAERHAKEVQKWVEYNALELRQLEFHLSKLNATSAELFARDQAQVMAALKDRLSAERKGIKGMLDAMQSKLNPALAAEKTQERRREIARLKARQERELRDYLALIEQTKQMEIDSLKERQGRQRGDRERQHEGEAERYIQEHHEAKRILAEIEARRIHEELEKNDSLRDGPPPPQRGK